MQAEALLQGLKQELSALESESLVWKKSHGRPKQRKIKLDMGTL